VLTVVFSLQLAATPVLARIETVRTTGWTH